MKRPLHPLLFWPLWTLGVVVMIPVSLVTPRFGEWLHMLTLRRAHKVSAWEHNRGQ